MGQSSVFWEGCAPAYLVSETQLWGGMEEVYFQGSSAAFVLGKIPLFFVFVPLSASKQ